jgi:hypothetical protein
MNGQWVIRHGSEAELGEAGSEAEAVCKRARKRKLHRNPRKCMQSVTSVGSLQKTHQHHSVVPGRNVCKLETQ